MLFLRKLQVNAPKCCVKIENECRACHYGMTQSQHCNNDNNHNDDNVMHASLWFVFLDRLLQCQKPHDIWEGNMTIGREIETENIHSLGCQDMRRGSLRRVILQRLECSKYNGPRYFSTHPKF